jgi:predicted DsbA family dithiol-disulfide isomerase
VGADHGIAFAIRPDRAPAEHGRTVHSLIALASEPDAPSIGLQSRVKEAFLHAYFLDGIDLTEDGESGRDRHCSRTRPDAGRAMTGRSAVARGGSATKTAAHGAIGVEGVPFFIFNGKLAVSGAQGAKALLEAMQQAETVARKGQARSFRNAK